MQKQESFLFYRIPYLFARIFCGVIHTLKRKCIFSKFEGVYQTDLDQFYDYYIPETLQLTSAYLEYLDAGIGEDIVNETEKEILDALKQLLIAVNDKVDEIYKFASIEIKAKAKQKQRHLKA